MKGSEIYVNVIIKLAYNFFRMSSKVILGEMLSHPSNPRKKPKNFKTALDKVVTLTTEIFCLAVVLMAQLLCLTGRMRAARARSLSK